MYASLLISLLAAFVAMLGKQWLNRYLRNSGGSMIERCGDRQRKCDGLDKWPLHFFVEGLPVMLQVALLLLACGLCRYMWSINTFVAYTLIGLTGLGVVFYVGIVIAGMTSYACPFQTPVSTALRGPWKKVWHGIVYIVIVIAGMSLHACPFQTPGSVSFRRLRKKVRRGVVSSVVRFRRALSRAYLLWNQNIRQFLHRQSPQTIPLENVQIYESFSALDNARQSEPWVKLKDLAIIRRTSTNDARCVSWVLRSITDPEALDAAIRLAGEIRWFDDGTDVDLPYGLIVSTYEACFDSAGKLYPGSRDKAYYSGRAVLWIQTLALCRSEVFANRFPLPVTKYTAPNLDLDLRHLLRVNSEVGFPEWRAIELLATNPEHTPSHSQWISDVLLHHCWANSAKMDRGFFLDQIPDAIETKTPIPLNATLNRLLAWCIFLGLPAKGEVLEIQDKSYDTSVFILQVSHNALYQ